MNWKSLFILLIIGFLNVAASTNENESKLSLGSFLRNLKEKIKIEDYPAIFGKGSIWDYFGTYPNTPNYGPNPIPPMPPVIPSFMMEQEEEEIVDQPQSNNIPVSHSPEYIKHEVVVTTKAELSCPEEFSLSGEECLKIDQKPSKLGCKEGWNYQDGFCKGVDVTAAKNVCDSGFEMGPDGQCTKLMISPYQIYCPDGYTLGSYNCFKQIYTNIEWICPAGYHENGHYNCHKEESVEPSKSCPEDFSLLGNYCRKEQTESPTYVCDSGYVDVGGVCEKFTQVPPDQTCPPEYLFTQGSCLKIHAHPGTLVCSQGELLGNQCVQRFDVPIIKSCPSGFQQTSDNVCTLNESAPAHPICQKGAKMDHSKSKCIGKKKEEVPIQYQCPKGFSMVSSNFCTKMTVQSPSPQCPHGHKMDKDTHSCYSQEFSKPEMICPSSYVLNEVNMKCEMTETTGTQLSCPTGFSFDSDLNVCSMKSTSQIVPQCLTPFVLSSDKQSCYHAQAFEPILTCPFGYELEYPTGLLKRFKEKANAICKGVVEAEPIPKCPGDFEYDSVNSQCIDTETLTPEIVCPEPFTDAHTPSQCSQLVASPSKPTCPIEYETMAGQCVKMLVEKPVMMCPIGYKLMEGVCVKQLFTKPSPICPTGYNYDALVGECYYMQVDYSFANVAPATSNPSGPKEALLSLDETTSTTTTTSAPEAVLPMQDLPPAPEPEVLPPSTVQIVQQPVPLPSPVVYLPAQAPMPPTPPPPPPAPIPYFVPQYISKKKGK